MRTIHQRTIIAPALTLTVLASVLALVTHREPAAASCEGALCALSCDEGDASASRCPGPLACVGDRCEARVDVCGKDEPVDACICSPPWVVSEGRCIDPFVDRVCVRTSVVRSAALFEETCESPSRCSQLLRLDGAILRGILEAAPVRNTEPWDSTVAGLPRVDRWLAEHERSSLYGGEPLVIVVAAPSAPPRGSKRRGVSPRSVSEALQAMVSGSMRERVVTITVPPEERAGRTVEFPPGSVTLVGFTCVEREEPSP